MEFRKIFALPFTSEWFPESDLDSLNAMCYWVPIFLNHHGIFIGLVCLLSAGEPYAEKVRP
jgi:hypothetical protein